MINLGYELRQVQTDALFRAADLTQDDVPVVKGEISFKDIGFRAVPQIRYKDKYGGRPTMAHIEGGFWMAKMYSDPNRNYDSVIDRLILICEAESKSGKSRFISVEDFSICEFIRIYAQFKGKINVSDAMWERLKAAIIQSEFAPYFEPMSENHKLCFLSSELIAAEMFENEVFLDGMTGKERLNSVKRSIKMFLKKRFMRGWSEYDSGSYYDINAISLYNIIDFSLDNELKKLASDSLNIMLAAMFHHSINGYPSGPKGRVYPTVMEDSEEGMYNLAVIAGEKNPHRLADRIHISAVYAALSHFCLDDEVYGICMGEKKENYEVFESCGLYSIPDDMYIKGKIYKYFYVGSSYCMGSVIKRDDPFENVAYTWLCGHQEQSWAVNYAKNSRATVFSSHPGNKKMFDFGMHGYWAGDCNCLCSEFVQKENVLLGYYNIKDNKQLDFIHFYIPKHEFDEFLYEESRIYLRIDNTVTIIDFSDKYFENTVGDYKDREVILPYRKCAFTVRIYENKTISELRRENSDLKLLKHGASFNGEDCILTINDGEKYIDNELLKADYPLYASPYVNSEYDSARVSITYEGNTKVYTFSEEIK